MGMSKRLNMTANIGLKGQNRTWERMLEKANNEKKILRHMAKHYWVRNHMCKARIRILKAKLKKASRRRKKHDKLQILVEASLAQHNTWWRTVSPNFKKFGTLFAILKFLAQKTNFFSLCVAPRGARFWWGTRFEEKSAFLDFPWKNMHAYQWPRNFDMFWAPKNVKNTQ